VFASRETAVWYWAALVCACAAALIAGILALVAETLGGVGYLAGRA
jgi:hypothetical protein